MIIRTSFIQHIYVIFVFMIFLKFLGACESPQKKLNFIYLPILLHERSDKSDSFFKSKRIEYYLVENFSGKKEQKILIDKFVNNNKFKGADSIFYYGIVFYKKTKETNEETIKNNPKIIGNLVNQNDLLYEYLWIRGKLTSKNDYTNQKKKKEEKEEIEIIDIPEIKN